MMTTDEIKIKFTSQIPDYERLMNNTKQALNQFLVESSISVFDVESRIKTWESFWDKVERKNYKVPLQEIEDIAGIRIINYYTSEIPKIIELINSEFEVVGKEDKADLLKEDQFGYRSFHFIVKIKENWTSAPQYRGLSDLKIEVQVRTILMHAWAAFNHKLSYKKESDIDPRFVRKINRLSALIELADEQFDLLQQDRKLFYESLITTNSVGKSTFDTNQPINVDTLQALLDYYYPNKGKLKGDGSDLVAEVINHNVSLQSLSDGFQKYYEAINEMEKEVFNIIAEKTKGRHRIEGGWSQSGTTRTLLELISESYWAERTAELEEKFLAVTRKWRKRLGLGET